MAVVGFKYKNCKIVCSDCFGDDEEEDDDPKLEALITYRKAKYYVYISDECGRLIA